MTAHLFKLFNCYDYWMVVVLSVVSMLKRLHDGSASFIAPQSTWIIKQNLLGTNFHANCQRVAIRYVGQLPKRTTGFVQTGKEENISCTNCMRRKQPKKSILVVQTAKEDSAVVQTVQDCSAVVQTVKTGSAVVQQ